jgi:hypothetical protein
MKQYDAHVWAWQAYMFFQMVDREAARLLPCMLL